jgi:hypothetical protein
MADSNNARGSVRASARKSARKPASGATPKGASKSRKSARAKGIEAPARPVEKPATAAIPGAPRIAATIPVAERLRMIAEAAYYRAQERGPGPADPQRDWLEAEAEIDAMLLRRLSDG